MVRAGDRDGALFTSDDLVTAVRWADCEEGLRPLVRELTSGPVDAPDKTWPEDILLLIALAIEERRERIRVHLKFSPEALESAFERIRELVQHARDEKAKAECRRVRSVQRLVSAADDAGELFTAEELFDVIRRSCSEADARELTAHWIRGGIHIPGKEWTESVLVMIALTIPERAERIRHHLGFSHEQMSAQLACERAYLRSPDISRMLEHHPVFVAEREDSEHT